MAHNTSLFEHLSAGGRVSGLQTGRSKQLLIASQQFPFSRRGIIELGPEGGNSRIDLRLFEAAQLADLRGADVFARNDSTMYRLEQIGCESRSGSQRINYFSAGFSLSDRGISGEQ